MVFRSWVARNADEKEDTVTRKRNAWTRARDRRRRRPRTPAPVTGWLISELAALTETPPRTLRYYRALRLLPGLAFRGTSTRYQRVHLLRMLAIQRLKAERVALTAIRQRLDGVSEDELVAFVSESGVGRAVAEALELVPAAEAPLANGESAQAGAPCIAIASTDDIATECWRHVRLLPGLELRIAADAGPLAHHLAGEIYRHNGGSGARR